MENTRFSCLEFVLSLILGVLYVVLTLPRGTALLGFHLQWDWLVLLGNWGRSVNESLASLLPPFSTLMFYTFVGLGLYLFSLLLLGLRHWQFGIFGWGVMGLILSIALFHLLTWGVFITLAILLFVYQLLGVLSGYINYVFGLVFGFMGNLLNIVGQFLWAAAQALWEFLYLFLSQYLGDLWWIGALLLIALVVFLVVKIWTTFAGALRIVLGLAVVAGIVYAIYQFRDFILPILETIGQILMSVVGFLILVFRAILDLMIIILGFLIQIGILLLALTAIVTLGQLLIDQIRSAFIAGNRVRGVIMGAIAVGSSVAILLMVSNVYGTNAYFPATIPDLVSSYLFQDGPILDVLILMVIIGFSVIGILSNLPHFRKEPTRADFGKSLVYAVVGVVMATGLAYVAGQTESG